MAIPYCDYHIASFFSHYTWASSPWMPHWPGILNSCEPWLHDRRTIGDAVYGMIRWKSLLDHLCPNAEPIERSIKISTTLFFPIQGCLLRPALECPNCFSIGLKDFGKALAHRPLSNSDTAAE